MHSPHTQALFYYWLGLRQNRNAPLRTDIEPRQIKSLLPNTFILEHIDDAHVVFRLAGTSFCDRYGREFRSHNFLSLWRGKDKRLMSHILNQSLENAAPAYILYRSETIARKAIDSEILLLPMKDSKNTLNRVLGCAHIISNEDALKTRKIVHQWITSYEFLSSPTWETTQNAGAPRPARVDKPTLRIISNSTQG